MCSKLSKRHLKAKEIYVWLDEKERERAGDSGVTRSFFQWVISKTR